MIQALAELTGSNRLHLTTEEIKETTVQHSTSSKHKPDRKPGWVKLLTCSLFIATTAHAESWPTQAIRVIVPYPSAGAADVAARIVAQSLAVRLGQPVVIDNHPGAQGTLVAKARPDGYTLLAATNPEITIMRHLRRTLPYRPDQDLVPLFRTATVPIVLVARNQNDGTGNLRAILEQARLKPDKLSYATPGIGTPMHLIMEHLSSTAGVRMHHIPYNGGNRAATDLMGKQVDWLAISLPTVAGQLKAGRLKALAVLQSERSPLLPETPTVQEASGVKVPQLPSVWFAWFAPANTPHAVQSRITAELEQIVKDPAIRQSLENAGLEPQPMAPAAMRQLLSEESDFFARAAKPFVEQ
ncbi:MAG: tripartite tricarboxylate transporter substrate binding protein [Comamonas sp.]